MKSTFAERLLPLTLIAILPSTSLVAWFIATSFQGEIETSLLYIDHNGLSSFLLHLWQSIHFFNSFAWQLVGGFILLQLILLVILPGPICAGPETPKRFVPLYKANGLPSFFVSLFCFYIGGYQFHWFSLSVIYDNFGNILASLNLLSICLSLLFYLKAKWLPSNKDTYFRGYFFSDLVEGCERYPRIVNLSPKQLMIRVGLTGWGISSISFACASIKHHGISHAMIVCLSLMLTYIIKNYWWESGLMRRHSVAKEFCGFQYCWQNLVGLPTLFSLPLLVLVQHRLYLHWFDTVSLSIIGSGSIFLTYFIDAQRQEARAMHGNNKIWKKKAEVIVAKFRLDDGTEKQTVLLTSGFWGMARHSHYVPEFITLCCWTFATGFSLLLNWVYLACFAIILLRHTHKIEQHCHAKYGHTWLLYCEKIPNRFLPAPYVKFTQHILKWWNSSTS